MNQAGEKMKRDCSLSRSEHGRSERHRVVKLEKLIVLRDVREKVN
jgi:hypothetical protein